MKVHPRISDEHLQPTLQRVIDGQLQLEQRPGDRF
jgi:hypothetical protein